MKNNNLNQYPNTRMRRLRKTRAIRELVEETSLNVNDLIYPVFITDKNKSENIELMPDIKRLCMDDLMQTAEKLVSLGIHAIALFPVIDKKYKSINGEEAYKSDGLIQKTIAKLKSKFPELSVITDVALDPYTTHGQDGIIDDNNYVTNDKTIQILKKQALSHAEAGADIVAPSDMMDGRIGAIRRELEKNNSQLQMKEKLAKIDIITENIMVQMIHTLSENGYDIADEQFILDVGFLSEVIKGALSRQVGLPHIIQGFIEQIMSPEKKETEDGVDLHYSRFDSPLLGDIIEIVRLRVLLTAPLESCT